LHDRDIFHFLVVHPGDAGLGEAAMLQQRPQELVRQLMSKTLRSPATESASTNEGWPGSRFLGSTPTAS
jgi:hypothetical protein